ncbi:DUF4837 family protein [Geojedonia litorea]|uniref:DUF4837 family protein n=1 Tax=Geojedonia litorea TaxID=1268269 RepID=A0ABV9N5W5_9FLAO
MKNTFLALTLTVLLVACGGESKNKRIVPNSSGNINNVSVVVDNLLWEDNVGEAIRDVLAAPLEGLPQDEPIFDLSQMPTQVFSGFTTKNRTILKIEKGKPADTKILSDVYAKPQVLALITGETNTEIIEQLNSNAEKIIDAFKKVELKEQQRRIALSLFDDKPLEENLGIDLKFSSVYRIAKEEDGFFWIRKDTKTGTMDLLVYQVPLDAIRKGDSAVVDIVKLRDSIGEQHIPGRIEGAHMATESAYSPYIFQTIIDNKPTLETKGIWDVKNDFMSGPFINYAIEDQVNGRYLIIEGYVFAPSVQKRDYMFELESIIRSVKIK